MSISQKKKDDLIVALLTVPTVDEAAEIAKVHRSTVYRLLNDESFKHDYNQARQENLKRIAKKLQINVDAAVAVLINIINDPEVKPQIRLNAIDTLLRHFYKFEEIANIEDRLEALEEATKQQE